MEHLIFGIIDFDKPYRIGPRILEHAKDPAAGDRSPIKTLQAFEKELTGELPSFVRHHNSFQSYPMAILQFVQPSITSLIHQY